MDKLLIRGGRRLQGEVRISGAKNATLPELCAALLSADSVTLTNVPRLQDVATMITLIRNMGVTVEQGDDGAMTLNAGALSSPEAPYERDGFFGNVVFTCGVLLHGDRLRVYYGAADEVTAVADLSLDEVLAGLD